MLLGEMKDVALWFCSFTAGLEGIQQQCRSRITLASAHVLYLNLLLHVWLLILEQWNVVLERGKFRSKDLYSREYVLQEYRRSDFNLQTGLLLYIYPIYCHILEIWYRLIFIFIFFIIIYLLLSQEQKYCVSDWQKCYDIAKQLSYYLNFFSFCFI